MLSPEEHMRIAERVAEQLDGKPLTHGELMALATLHIQLAKLKILLHTI